MLYLWQIPKCVIEAYYGGLLKPGGQVVTTMFMYIFQSSRLESIGRFSGFAEPSMKSIKSDLTDLARSLDGPRLSPVSTKDPASTSAGGLSQSVTSRIQRDCDPVQRGPPCCCHDALPRTVVRSCQVEPWMPTVIPLNHNHI